MSDALIYLCEEKVVASDAALPPKLLQKNVAYGNKNKLFLHIYIFFCTFVAIFVVKSKELCINQVL